MIQPYGRKQAKEKYEKELKVVIESFSKILIL